MRVAQSRDGARLGQFINETVADEVKFVYTDEWPAYKTIPALQDEDTRHDTVTHSKKEWVRGDVHTNTVESVWSLLKRSIIGSYHHVSVKHLDSYLDELEFRFNNRKNPFMFRDVLLRILDAEALRYDKLTA